MAYREQEQGNIISVTKKQYNDLNQGLSVKGYKKTKKDILVPCFNDIYSKGEMDSKIAQIAYCTNNNGTLSISDEELKKIVSRHNDHLLLKMEDVSTRNIEILKLVAYSEQESQQGFFDYIFSNGVSEINLTVDETGDVPVIDDFLLFGATVSKATYADYAIKNPNGSYSKFTHNSNGVLKVGDTHIVSKKKLLWSGEENISGEVGDNIPIYTSTTDLKGKSLEIWLKDKGTLDNNNMPNSPYAIKVKVLDINEWSYLYDAEKLDMYNSKFKNSKTLAFQHISLLYNPTAFKIFGRCYLTYYNLNTFTTNIGLFDCYVTAIYEIIE